MIGTTVKADGIPTTQPLVYTGTLLSSTGAPVTTTQTAVLSLWDDAANTANSNKKCEGATVNITPDSRGLFQLPLDPMCLDVVRATPNLWVQLQVSNAILPRTKLSAVPYAVEAGRASEAGGSLDTRLRQMMPAKTVVNVALSAAEVTMNFNGTGLALATSAYFGWALCNGSNGTPNLNGRFVRVSTTGSGATGGVDVVSHIHPIDHDHPAAGSSPDGAHTHSTPNHLHTLPFGYDGSFFFWGLDGTGFPLYGSVITTVSRSTPGFPVPPATGATRLALTDSSGGSTTGSAGNHTHNTDLPALTGSSGQASNTENRPAFLELVAIMRL